MPTDVSFADISRGWIIAEECGADCDSAVLATTDGGRHWRRVGMIGSNGSAQRHVRFIDSKTGYAWDPDFAVTPDGGHTWAVSFPYDGDRQSERVLSVQAVGSSIWALALTGCAVTGASEATCDRTLFTSLGGGAWRTIRPAGGISGPMAQLVRSGRRAWIVSYGDSATPRDKALLRTDDDGKTWKALHNPCAATAYAADERIVAPSPSSLWLFCAKKSAGGSQKKILFTSSDGGLHWHLPLEAPGLGVLGSAAIVSEEVAFLSLPGGGVWRTTDGSRTWRTVLRKGDEAGWGGIDFVGSKSGWVLFGTYLYRTIDGGRRWSGVVLP